MRGSRAPCLTTTTYALVFHGIHVVMCSPFSHAARIPNLHTRRKHPLAGKSRPLVSRTRFQHASFMSCLFLCGCPQIPLALCYPVLGLVAVLALLIELMGARMLQAEAAVGWLRVYGC